MRLFKKHYIIIIALLSTPQMIHAQLWPTKKNCTNADDSIIKRNIEISPGNLMQMEFQITTKGNGVISVPGLNIRIYDGHDDGLMFENQLLKCEWKDIDADGFLDLVVSGNAIRKGDEEDAKPTMSVVYGVFHWNNTNRQFEITQCSPEIYTWIPSKPDKKENESE